MRCGQALGCSVTSVVRPYPTSRYLSLAGMAARRARGNRKAELGDVLSSLSVGQLMLCGTCWRESSALASGLSVGHCWRLTQESKVPRGK